MDGDITYRYVAHPLKAGGYYISIQQEKVPSSSTKNVKNKLPKASNVPSQGTRQILSISPPAANNTQSRRSTAEMNNVQLIEEYTLSKILAAGNPITLGDGLRTGELHPTLPDQPMGSLILRTSPPEKPIKEMITHGHGPDGFEVVFRRHGSANELPTLQALRPDDAAIVVRVFMLAKIATARLEMRAALHDVATHRNKLVDQQKIIKSEASPAKKAAARASLKQLLHKLETGEHDRHADPSVRVTIEHTLAILMQRAQQGIEHHKNWVYFLSTAGFGAALFWIWAPYLFGYHNAWSGLLGWTLFALSCVGGILFLLNALNLKSVELRIEEKIHEETIERLNVTLASLVQTNANVAALNLTPRPQDGFPSELLLHQMDEALHLKERLVSIEGVIKAREIHLASSVSHIEEHRDSVRRSIMAAGSGVFVGFFTYEVGESLMDYLHVAHQQDKNAMLYWLMANSERIKPRIGTVEAAAPLHTPGSQAETVSRQPPMKGPPSDDYDAISVLPQSQASLHAKRDTVPEAQGHAVAPEHAPPLKKHAAAEIAGSAHDPGTVHTTAHGAELDPVFVDGYHRPELYAQSWLLTITIVISVLTAWIAIRKPAAEQGAGHGHH